MSRLSFCLIFLLLLQLVPVNGRTYDISVIEPNAAQDATASWVWSEAFNERGEFVVLANPEGIFALAIWHSSMPGLAAIAVVLSDHSWRMS